MEPDLTQNEVAKILQKVSFRTGLKRLLINLHNVNNNEKLSHMVTSFDSGLGYYTQA